MGTLACSAMYCLLVLVVQGHLELKLTSTSVSRFCFYSGIDEQMLEVKKIHACTSMLLHKS